MHRAGPRVPSSRPTGPVVVACVAAIVAAAATGCRAGLLSRDRDGAPIPAPTAASAVVPDLRGRDVATAARGLEAAGLLVGVVEAWPDALGYPAGTVVATSPMRGTEVRTGATVDLRVYGITDAAARRATADARAGRVAGPSAVAPPSAAGAAPTAPPATVARPPAGALATARVPDVVGRPLPAAIDALRGAGLEVAYERVAGAPEGTVLSQDVAAGVAVPRGAPVRLRVARGGAEVATAPPDVVAAPDVRSGPDEGPSVPEDGPGFAPPAAPLARTPDAPPPPTDTVPGDAVPSPVPPADPAPPVEVAPPAAPAVEAPPTPTPVPPPAPPVAAEPTPAAPEPDDASAIPSPPRPPDLPSTGPVVPTPRLPLPDAPLPAGPPPTGATPPPDDVVPSPRSPPFAPPVAPPVAPPADDPSAVPMGPPKPFVLPPDAATTPAADGTIIVPPFLDRTVAQARRIAADAGLVLKEEPAANGLPGRVMDQVPAAGERVRPGAEIVVRVPVEPAPTTARPAPSPSAGPLPAATAPAATAPAATAPASAATPAEPAPTATPPVAKIIVPSVLDRTQLVARRMLEDSGLRVREEGADHGIPGRVMDQNPLPGDRVAPDTEVVLKIPGWQPRIPAPVETAAVGSPDAPPPSAAAPSAPEPPAPPVVPEAPAIPSPPPAPPAAPSAAPPVAPPPTTLPPPAAVPPAPPEAPPVPVAPPVSPTPPAPTAVPPTLPTPGGVPTAPPATAPAPLTVPPAPVPAGPVPPTAVPAPSVAAEPPPATVPTAPVAPPVAPPAPTVPPAPVETPGSTEGPGPTAPPPAPAPSPDDAVPVVPKTSVARAVPPEEFLDVPTLVTPADGATLPAAKFVHADLTWAAVANATGYLLEVEESVDGTWMPILRKVVKEPKAVLEIEPTGGVGTYRWRVRGVLGRRGGRASAWATVVVR